MPAPGTMVDLVGKSVASNQSVQQAFDKAGPMLAKTFASHKHEVEEEFTVSEPSRQDSKSNMQEHRWREVEAQSAALLSEMGE
ncbi:hypothetical protein N0V93_006766 [Gnomoniopsis smithogilvyi]|uniref:Uncharacterized protein n=1 Tax=Gnomoniopsis smithogilvyi TaxID=1191159 RepID=A0A9W9CVY3_9PEZI|nr:hypothetical protein N0V93_006766 [Gnomoniopsis smithogilvyi]